MHRRHALKALAGLVLCPVCAPAGFAAPAGWSYEDANGPAAWGNLDTANRACATGVQQSPIDIETPVKAQLPPLEIAWAKTADTIVNNGHTIQLNFGAGSSLTVGKETYALLQVHFHRPSEHRIGGKSFPMEAHFVHRHASGGLAALGVLMTAGKTNAAFARVAATMPAKAGVEAKADAGFNPNGMLPARRNYYRYPGSLTTPPCSETVEWRLLSQPIEVAEADIAAFARLYPMNARPAQKPNRRDVLLSG